MNKETETPRPDAVAGRLDGLVRECGQAIPESYPPRHQKFVVRRDGAYFTATPCYGMHDPWWVVRIMGNRHEAEPEPMRDGDEWFPLPNAEVSRAND